MQPFTTLTGAAAPLALANVDTDKIIPGRFLKTIGRSGLGRHLFEDLRYHPDGREREDFVLNRPPFREARILLALENFGCGSSREHAPWALLDFGVRCVIAPSFADIFAANAAKNGILLIALPESECARLMADAELGANGRMSVDLERQEITRATGERLRFEVDPYVRRRLLSGLDDIGETLRQGHVIDAFEDRRRGLAHLPEISI